MEAFTYKGISAGKYVEGEIEALNQEEKLIILWKAYTMKNYNLRVF